MVQNEKQISIKSFISSLTIIFLLMCLSYGLSFVLPGGEYTRTISEAGNEIIDTRVPFQFVQAGIPFYKFILSPFLVLGSDGNVTLIAIVIFLFVIGGIFKCLQESKILNYFLNKITYLYIASRYKLISIIALSFMLMGAFMGSAEEIIPMVPILVSLCNSLGFDTYTGLAVSVLAGSCGFASGVGNPFTIGIAHRLAGLPIYSGFLYRLFIFVVIYGLLMVFIIRHAKKIEKNISKCEVSFQKDENYEKATRWFVISMGIGMLCVLLSCVVTVLQDYTMIIVALMFLMGGITSCIGAKVPFKEFMKNFKEGAISFAPGALTILMASSIRYILVEAKILDTILYYLISVLDGLPIYTLVLFVFFIFLIMEVFISSGSAKAFLLMPLLLPIGQVFHISSRLISLAFAFGDGFSNELYPTNVGLLVSLSLADVSYKDWLKFSYKFFLLIFVLCCVFLMFGLSLGY